MKAIAMISGGLDSSLAVKIIQNNGIEVIGVHFLIPFTRIDSTTVYNSAAQKISQQLDFEFRVEVLSDVFLETFKNPKYGYGKNLNPCIDCKILMLKKAKEIMLEEKAAFVFTGEVLGQRPMSQHTKALKIIERDSGLEGMLVRPLSANLLNMTLPQKQGLIKPSLLFSITGRGRRQQLELAKKWKITKFPWPGGGCLLTETGFCRRLKETISHHELSLENIELLKQGRHFRINGLKFVVGRNEKENHALLSFKKGNDTIFEPKTLSGPAGLLIGELNPETEKVCCQIIARYTSNDEAVDVTLTAEGLNKTISAKPLAENKLSKLIV
ncbi:MAG: tRNA 4-thiouridine(8) synthase ThiI [Candidatus Omnitrophica bacterium]|nr:tRNA 4-thiouridine(8) synthase ThiI [Candidatus Omnitrophota bacterium]